MFRIVFILPVLLLFTTSAEFVSFAKPTTQPAGAAQIDKLIAQFTADTWSVRQQAEDQLVQYGDEAHERLGQILQTSRDEEMRARCELALRRIEENRVAGASLITLHFKDALPKDVFDAVARQGHTEFHTYPPQLWEDRDWPRISVDVDRQPFWTVVKDLSNKVGLCPQPGYGSEDRHMALGVGFTDTWLGSASVISGPFVFVGQQVQRTNTANLLQGSTRSDFTIQLTAFAEPKLRILSCASMVRLEEAVDNRGNSLLGADYSTDTTSTGSNWGWNLTAQLSFPANAGDRIAKLKGVARFVMQTRYTTLEFPVADVLSGKVPPNITKSIGESNYQLRQIRPHDEQQYTVSVRAQRDGRTQQEWSHFCAAIAQGQCARLIDAKDRALESSGPASTSNDGQLLEITYQFSHSSGDESEQIGPPVKFAWDIPQTVKTVEIPFELANLPLP